MRRAEKEIHGRSEIDVIMQQSKVCRLGLCDGTTPYVVPVNFGYRDDTVYVHSAVQGRKMDILRRNPKVCFECDIDPSIVESENACQWGMRYRSVIGFGTASLIDDPEQKQKALNIIMEKYAGTSFAFPESTIKKTAVIKIKITDITGKQSGF